MGILWVCCGYVKSHHDMNRERTLAYKHTLDHMLIRVTYRQCDVTLQINLIDTYKEPLALMGSGHHPIKYVVMHQSIIIIILTLLRNQFIINYNLLEINDLT